MNFNNTYKNRFDKKNKKRIQRKRDLFGRSTACRRQERALPRVNQRKMNALRVHASCVERRATFLKDKLRKEGQIPKALNHTRSQNAGEEYKLPVIETQVRTSRRTKLFSQKRDLMELLVSLERKVISLDLP